MAEKTLATTYRPKTFDDIVEQDDTKHILTHQIDTDTIKNVYLFVGAAGTGKTSSARIFASEINKGKGTPIELDAASHNSVDDIRNLIQQARTSALDSEYKTVILDEVQALSSSAWQALLKIFEEPPSKCIFILCTTNPEKIPKTILSRVQRYDFHRISHKGIVDRLWYICRQQYSDADSHIDNDAIELISKISDGGMRDAISLLDKCLSYSENLTIDVVVKALGTVDYADMFKLNDYVFHRKVGDIITLIEDIHLSGRDLKQFIKSYMNFLLDISKWDCVQDFKYIQIPSAYKDILDSYDSQKFSLCLELLNNIVKLNSDIRYETSPKAVIEANFVLFVTRED